MLAILRARMLPGEVYGAQHNWVKPSAGTLKSNESLRNEFADPVIATVPMRMGFASYLVPDVQRLTVSAVVRTVHLIVNL